MADLLGTEEGIEALAKFLKSSGAFTKTEEPKAKPPKPSLDDEEPRDGDAGAQEQEWGEASGEESTEGSDEGDKDGEDKDEEDKDEGDKDEG
jgi:hypothetical protein